MEKLVESLINHYVVVYLALVVVVQILVAAYFRRRRSRVQRRRRAQGLDDKVLIDHAVKLAAIRAEAITQAVALLLSVFFGPILVIAVASALGEPVSDTEKEGLCIVLLGLVLWLLWSGTDVAKAFLGGLAFKTVNALKHPIQVGDRVTLQGHTGKLAEVGTFFVQIRISGATLISIPTNELWRETLVSLNAGQRHSRSVTRHYLSPRVTRAQRQAAEDALWDGIQASPYLEPSQSIQIQVSQERRAIVLTAKAFVASTYNAKLFESDVARAFLDRCADEGIPLPDPCDGADY